MPASATDREAAVRAAFAEQAVWAERLDSPLTALLCRQLGETLDRSTDLGRRVLTWPGEPAATSEALALRLCGSLHHLVRGGGAPGLARCYPPNPLPEPEALWEALEPVLADPRLLPWLDNAPQTNEVGRSAVLMAGLLAVAERFPQPVELLELGASAGLNLILDRYGYELGGTVAGDPSSPLQLRPEWKGPPPPGTRIAIASRRGVDLQPLDPVHDGEKLLAYVWPDHAERLARLQTALVLAGTNPPRVETGDAAEWLEARLREPAAQGRTRVVFHSVAYQYFPADRQVRIAEAIEAAGARSIAEAPLAWLRYEKLPKEKRYSLRLRLWPGREEELLAWAHPHGASISWIRAR